MEVITCKSCGKIFNYISGSRICPQCVKKMDEKFAEVKKYVYDHPKVGINELAEENRPVAAAPVKKGPTENKMRFLD